MDLSFPFGKKYFRIRYTPLTITTTRRRNNKTMVFFLLAVEWPDEKDGAEVPIGHGRTIILDQLVLIFPFG